MTFYRPGYGHRPHETWSCSALHVRVGSPSLSNLVLATNRQCGLGVTVTSGTSAAVSPYSLRYAACTASAWAAPLPAPVRVGHLRRPHLQELGMLLLRLLVVALLARRLDDFDALRLLWF